MKSCRVNILLIAYPLVADWPYTRCSAARHCEIRPPA